MQTSSCIPIIIVGYKRQTNDVGDIELIATNRVGRAERFTIEPGHRRLQGAWHFIHRGEQRRIVEISF